MIGHVRVKLSTLPLYNLSFPKKRYIFIAIVILVRRHHGREKSIRGEELSSLESIAGLKPEQVCRHGALGSRSYLLLNVSSLSGRLRLLGKVLFPQYELVNNVTEKIIFSSGDGTSEQRTTTTVTVMSET